MAGKIVAGPLVRRACERHLRDLSDGAKRGLVWSVPQVERALGFFRDVLRLNGGEHEGKPFILQPWQAFIVGSLCGWRRRDGTRRFRTAYVEVGKGNGKTPMAGGLGIMMMVADGEPRAEVYAAATNRDQAMILFRDAVAMVELSPELTEVIEKSGNQTVYNLAYLRNGSFFRPVASDTRAKSGYRPHCALLDELHEHRTGEMVAKMRLGVKGRRQPLMFEITNSGTDRQTIAWEHHEYSRQVVEGSIADDEWFAYVCALDAEDDWQDERVWIKANPNLGVSITKDYLRKAVREAQGMPSQLSLVRRLNFCQWVEGGQTWLDLSVWDQSKAPLAVVAGPKVIAYGGLDLSSHVDLAAFVRVVPEVVVTGEDAEGKPVEETFFDVLPRFYLPEENLSRRVHKDAGVPYDAWAHAGHIVLTPGNVIDYDFIKADVLAAAKHCQLKECAYDPWSATQIALQLQADGLTMVEFRQGFASMSEPTKALEKVVLGARLRHGGHPVLRWMAGNVVVARDPAGNLKPNKERSTEKIDGIVALIMALGRAVLAPPPKKSVYERRGVRSF